MEQMPLNFERGLTREELTALPIEELYKHYQKKHGRDIGSRVWSTERIVDGILRTTEDELAVTREEDRASDKEDIENTYRRKY